MCTYGLLSFQLPAIIEKPKTPEPVPEPEPIALKRRIRKIPKGLIRT